MSVLRLAHATPDLVPDTVRSLTWNSVGIGTAIIVAAVALSWVVRWLLRRFLCRVVGRTPSSASAFSEIARWAIIIVGVGAALAVVFPSVKPVNVLGGLGIVSVAAGIAFQTVLGNMFAGLVILMRETPIVGDQIKVNDIAGTITQINLNTTTVRTFDGRMVLIPNSVIHANAVTVQTGHEWVRTAFTVKIRGVENFQRAREVAIAALSPVPAVVSSPAPEAVLREVHEDLARMEVRFWSGSRQMDTVAALDAAILAVTVALDEEGIPIGSDRSVVLDSGGLE